jgi:hypothetical protein
MHPLLNGLSLTQSTERKPYQSHRRLKTIPLIHQPCPQHANTVSLAIFWSESPSLPFRPTSRRLFTCRDPLTRANQDTYGMSREKFHFLSSFTLGMNVTRVIAVPCTRTYSCNANLPRAIYSRLHYTLHNRTRRDARWQDKSQAWQIAVFSSSTATT